MHVFSYSPRPGTKAALLPQLPASEIKRRAEILRELDKELRADFSASLVGTEQEVFIEERNNERPHGITSNFQSVILEDSVFPLHGLVPVQITRAEGPLCFARVKQ